MALDLNYQQLYSFWITAKAGRVAGAAKELGLSQSALNAQLKSLERSLGRPLLSRARGGLTLTAEGRTAFEHCERIFFHGAALSAALTGVPVSSVIRLGVSAALGREAAMAFISSLAAIEDATLTVHVGPRDDLQERLEHRQLDIVVAATDLSARLGKEFQGRRIETLPINFMASPALARALPGFPRRGQKVPMLLRTYAYPPRLEVERFLRERGVIASVVAESEDADILQTLARQGRGVVPLHRSAARADLDSGSLERIGPAQTGLHQEVWLVTPSVEPVDPIIRRAIALVNRS